MGQPRARPSLRLLHIFQAVVDEGSVGAAARIVGISQPAVTQSLNRIEAMLGVRLLERARSGCAPTEIGALLHRRAVRLFDGIEAALGEKPGGAPLADGRRAQILSRRITDGHVQALAAIDEAGSIDGAARRLGISAPAVQRTARGLEALLRRSLFSRGPHGVATSRSGAELARRLLLAVREFDDAVEEIEMAHGSGLASLSLGVLPLACAPVLAAALADLTREYPGVTIRVTEAVYEPLTRQLRSGRIDILFGVLRQARRPDDVVELALFHDPHVVVARCGHPLTCAAEITMADLARFDWIAPPTSSPRRQLIDHLFARSDLRPVIAVETNSLATLKALLAIGDHVTLLARHDAEREVQAGALAIVPFGRAIQRDPTGLAMRANWQPTAIQRRFVDLARAHAGAFFPDSAARGQDVVC